MFMLDSVAYDYSPDYQHNEPRWNERRVQLPLAMKFIDTHLPDVVEIGAVTCYYRETDHTIYDVTDKHRSAINKDIRDVEFFDSDWVVSISVMQFIGGGGYGDPVGGGPGSAVGVIDRILRNSAGCMLTWPNGYNELLDGTVFSGRFDDYISFMQRDEDNTWAQVGFPSLREYNFPYKRGNSICVLRK